MARSTAGKNTQNSTQHAPRKKTTGADGATGFGSATLYAAAGDNQSVAEGKEFPLYLRAQATGANLSGAVITFTLYGPAVFDYQYTPMAGTGRVSDTQCTVPFNSQAGVAISPAIRAGNLPGTATATATSPVASNTANWNSLVVTGTAPPATATLAATAGDNQSTLAGNEFPLFLKVQAAGASSYSGAFAVYTLSGPAAFDYSHLPQAGIQQINATQCRVPFLSTGLAVSPALRATSTPGVATATATSIIASNTARWNSLAVTAPPPTHPAFYVFALRGDRQHALAGHAFDTQLAVNVIAQDQRSSPNGGAIVFQTQTGASDGVGQFGSANPVPAADVTYASPLTAVRTASGAEHSTLPVIAYVAGTDPSSLPANSQQVAHFSLQIWAAATARLALDPATDGQTTQQTRAFPLALAVMVTDSVQDNLIADVQVTFKVTSGSAHFGSGSSSATVSSNANGIAVSPTLTAGAADGPVTVAASATIAGNMQTFHLTVGVATPAITDELILDNPSDIYFAAGGSQPVTWKLQTISGKQAIQGKAVTLKIDDAGGASASFANGSRMLTHNGSTNANGEISATVYAGDVAGAFAINASEDAGEAKPISSPFYVLPMAR